VLGLVFSVLSQEIG